MPTFNELDVKFVDETSWYAVFAPKGTPPEIIKVNADLTCILGLPDAKEKGVTLGYRYVGGLLDKLRARRARHRARMRVDLVLEHGRKLVERPADEVVLEVKDFEPWLSGKAGLELLKPATDDVLQRWLVSKRVDRSRTDAEDAILINMIAV